jgi:hypothetical protein
MNNPITQAPVEVIQADDFQQGYLAALIEVCQVITGIERDAIVLPELDEWIEEHRQEIAECPATPKGYRKAGGLRWGLARLEEYRAALARDERLWSSPCAHTSGGYPRRRGLMSAFEWSLLKALLCAIPFCVFFTLGRRRP